MMICLNDMDYMTNFNKYGFIFRLLIVVSVVFSMIIFIGSESFADECHDDNEVDCSHYCGCLVCNSHIFVINHDSCYSNKIYQNIYRSIIDKPSQYEKILCSGIDRPPKSK